MNAAVENKNPLELYVLLYTIDNIDGQDISIHALAIEGSYLQSVPDMKVTSEKHTHNSSATAETVRAQQQYTFLCTAATPRPTKKLQTRGESRKIDSAKDKY